MDANVIIDLFQCDKTILPRISRYVGQIAVATTIIEEIQCLALDDCRQLGMRLVEPTIGQVYSAIHKPKPLSFYDWLCYLLARQHQWICVSNDKALRKQCTSSHLAVMWEFEMLCLLVENGGLSREKCCDLFFCIKSNNPFFITDAVVTSALRRLENQS
jgi:rRNA-processing protein FCF1